MKRQLPLVVAILSMFPGFLAFAQAQDPVAAAARAEAEERYRTLAARVERLEESIHAYQERILNLSKEVYNLREEVDRQKNRNENAATLDKISRLQDSLRKVDDARMEDNKKILAELPQMEKRLRTAVERALKGLSSPPPPVADTPAPANTSKAPPENAREYTIKSGDTLSAIFTSLRSQGYKVTQKQIEDVNPGVNWNRLRIGQKIIIPPPSP